MPKSKSIPRLAIGQPFIPKMKINESITAYGDDSGQPYFKAGDNPNEEEVVSVSPRSKLPVSMAYGGVATISNDPLERRRNQARTRINQLGQLSSARRDIPGLEAAGQAQYLRSSEDRDFSRLGIPTPSTFDVPQGVQFNPGLSRASIRTPEQYLSEQFNEQNAMQDVQDELANLNYQPSQSTQRRTNVSSRVQSNTPDRITSTRTASPRSQVKSKGSVEWIQDPATGKIYEADPDEVPEARAELAKRAGTRAGLVAYDDPFNPTGQPQYITPAEAAIRKARDDRRIKSQIDRETGETDLKKLSPDDLVDALIDNPDQLERDTIKQELRSRGFSERAMSILIRQEQARRASSKQGQNDAIDYEFYKTGGGTLTFEEWKAQRARGLL